MKIKMAIALKERVVYRSQSGKATEASVRQSAKRQLPRLASPCHRVAKRVPIIRLAAWKRDSCNPSTEPEQTSHSGLSKAEHSLFEILSINRPLICWSTFFRLVYFSFYLVWGLFFFISFLFPFFFFFPLVWIVVWRRRLVWGFSFLSVCIVYSCI